MAVRTPITPEFKNQVNFLYLQQRAFVLPMDRAPQFFAQDAKPLIYGDNSATHLTVIIQKDSARTGPFIRTLFLQHTTQLRLVPNPTLKTNAIHLDAWQEHTTQEGNSYILTIPQCPISMWPNLTEWAQLNHPDKLEELLQKNKPFYPDHTKYVPVPMSFD